MRYMQMIKRCKLPLKKATSDMEAHGEEHAKLCKLSTADLKPSISSVDDRLGHLKNSAVARLLVEGKLPAESVPSPKAVHMSEAAMDLSNKSSVLGGVRSYQHEALLTTSETTEMADATAERLRQQMGAEMEALKKRGSSNEVRFAGWKCRYCPFTAHSAKKLYSHYQFHQQLLTSQSSKPHLEWLSAYRQSKDFAESQSQPVTSSAHVSSSQNGTSSTAEGGFVFSQKEVPVGHQGFELLNSLSRGRADAECIQSLRSSGLSLRYLLGNSNQQSRSDSSENSASGCLRSIVKQVMRKEPATTPMGHPTAACLSPNMNNSGKTEPGENCGEMNGIPMKRDSPHHYGITDIQAPNPSNVEQNPSDVYGYHLNPDLPKNISEAERNVSPMHSVDKERTSIRIERVNQHLSVPHRPMSRESNSSYTSSTTSEEINVTDLPPQPERTRMDSLMSDTSDPGLLKLTSRKRSHSVESETSSMSSPPGLNANRIQQSRDQCMVSTSPNVSNYSQSFYLNCTKSPRLDCDRVKKEIMDTQPSNSSPSAVISSTGTPPPMQWSGNNVHCQGIPRSEISSQDKLESSVQCELLVPPSGSGWQELSGDQGESLDYQYNSNRQHYNRCSSVTGCIKCPHCGIAFDDSVLHSIHMGCHSHSDPFICNVCGEACHNRYGFYTHIMRGHHSS